MNIPTIVAIARNASYNEATKRQFKTKAMKALRDLAEALQLKPEHYDVRFNPGGIAVSGEATLHHEAFYLQIGGFGAFWRTCKNQKDYTGGPNQWVCGADRSCGLREPLTFLELKHSILKELTLRNF